MKFSLVTLYVDDMEKSLHFYRDLLGQPVLSTGKTGDGRDMVFLGEAGQPSIELISAQDGEKHAYTGFSIGFDVTSMEDAVKGLADAGYPLVRGPFSPGPGTALAFLRGPGGEEVELLCHAR